jgi:hypothetical protein
MKGFNSGMKRLSRVTHRFLTIIVLASVSTTCLALLPCGADESGTEDKPVRSIEGLQGGADSGEVGDMKSEYLRNSEDVEEAVVAGKRALDKNPDSIESHLVYAQALERKLHFQKQKDPQLFAQCVKEWLIVLRNESGEEKGLSAHGISVFGHLMADESHSILAKQHLTALCGRGPKGWETDTVYLRKILKNVTVHGKIISPSSTSTSTGVQY